MRKMNNYKAAGLSISIDSRKFVGREGIEGIAKLLAKVWKQNRCQMNGDRVC